MSEVRDSGNGESLLVQALRQAFSHRPFVVAVLVMAVAAFGIGAATTFLQLKFRKQPVRLTQALETVPPKMGPWVQVSTDQPLDADLEHTLGTTQYIFRDYVDSRLVGAADIDAMLAKPDMDRRRALAELESHKPRAVVHLGVTYYTGMVDTVAHVPDRCYIADGYAPTDYETRKWKLGTGENVEVRFINFEDATGFTSRVSKNVAYFFQVNGAIESSPTAVRIRLQDLFNANVYYAKVELMTLMRNREDAARIMSDFLSAAFPEVKKCLPQSGQGKATETAGAVSLAK